MEFCPKCKSIMMVSSGKASCARCGYSSDKKVDLEVKEKVSSKKSVAVINDDIQTYPITDYKCKKCGHDKSYFWTRQMRAGDEPESKFFKCVKCKNTVRED